MTTLLWDARSGDERKAQGLEAIEETDRHWIQRMRESAIKISLLKGMVSTDDLRPIADQSGDHPKHVNSWGAIFRGTLWMTVGRKKSTWPSTNGREIHIWKYTGVVHE